MLEATRAPRTVGVVGAALMNVNGMIGAGIFALPALLHSRVGDFAPWLFLIFGLFYSCTVLVAARLSTLFDSSGGPQLYVQTAFGPAAGFQVGWLIVIAAAAGRAASLYVLVSYLAVFFPSLQSPQAGQLVVLALVLVLSGLTMTGMRNSMGGLMIGTVLKLGPIIAICGMAFASRGVPANLQFPPIGQFGSVALLVYFAFSGGATSTYSAGEIKDPQRNLPRSMLLSLALIVLFYMMVQAAFSAAGAPQTSGNATPLAAAAGALAGNAGVTAITIAAIFSIATNALTFFVAAPRVIFGMAERKLLPSTFAHLSVRFLTPDRAILLYTVIVSIVSVSGTFALLANVLSLAAQVWTITMFAAFIKLQMLDGVHRSVSFMVRWGAIVVIGTGFALYAITQAPREAFGLVAGLLLVGLVIYRFARSNSAPTPALPTLDLVE